MPEANRYGQKREYRDVLDGKGTGGSALARGCDATGTRALLHGGSGRRRAWRKENPSRVRGISFIHCKTCYIFNGQDRTILPRRVEFASEAVAGDGPIAMPRTG